MYSYASAIVLYYILYTDSNFWRRLEYLANGPFPNFAPLDIAVQGGVRFEEPQVAQESSASIEQRQSGIVSSASVAPLLKLPRHGTLASSPHAVM